MLLADTKLVAALVLGGETVGSSPELLATLFRGVAAIVATPGKSPSKANTGTILLYVH